MMNNGSLTSETLQVENERLRRRIAELEQSKTDYERFFALSIDMLCIIGFDGTFKLLNPAFERTLGFTSEEVLTRPLTSFIHPDDQEAVLSHLDQAHMGKNVPTLQSRYRCSDNTYKWIECQLAGWPEQGVVFATARDITERKRIEVEHERLTDALQCQANELRIFKTLVENMPDGVGVVNNDGIAVYANPALFRIHDYGDTKIGMDMSRFFPPTLGERVPEVFREIFHQLSNNERMWQGEINGKRKDGSVFSVLATNFLIQDDTGQPQATVGIIRDITEQKRTELERVQLQQAIIETQRTAIRELSTPLLPITSSVVAMPLVGSIDSIRAQEIVAALLQGVNTYAANVVIIDITGIKVIDSQIAIALLQAAQAVKLLGARVVLTGIGPGMAQTLVHLGADLSSVVTRSNLQSGIAYAMNLNTYNHNERNA